MITELADFTVKRGDAITTLSVKVNFKNTAERIPLTDLLSEAAAALKAISTTEGDDVQRDGHVRESDSLCGGNGCSAVNLPEEVTLL
jgi:hypothetical protein